jgi:hypothetical protein
MANQKKCTIQLPSPAILQRASKAVLAGKCRLSKPSYIKLKKHRKILRQLARMKGSTLKKKAFVQRNKKQVGGMMPLLPIILSAIGSVAGPLLKTLA